MISLKKPMLIAEIGSVHDGSFGNAKKLIELAANSGADAVKFQKRDIDIVYDKKLLDSFRESPWGNTQRDQKNGLEFGKKEYDQIDLYCKNKINWFASAWDIPSQDFLKQFELPVNKIASAMATNLEFVEHVAKEGKPTFVSTGMTTLEEIDNEICGL